MELFGIGIGNWISIIAYIIAFIVGYIKLSDKVSNMQENFKQYKIDINRKIQCQSAKTQKIYQELASIRETISGISAELGKLTGMIEMYIKIKQKQ